MEGFFPPFFLPYKIFKYTLIITEKCNLACDYCYAQKKDSRMSLSTARKIVNFIFSKAQTDAKLHIGFFGGEPLLEFSLMKYITALIKNHKSFTSGQVSIGLTTNGTILSDEIIDFFLENNVTPCISCDGPSEIHDLNRHFANGSGSSALVELNIRKACKIFPLLPVNAVYSPSTLQFLPKVVEYIASLGVRNILLSQNISAKWTEKEAAMLPEIYRAIEEIFLNFYSKGQPRYVSLIDEKVSAILRGGYVTCEKCAMGKSELAFSTSGKIYPCERLAGLSDSHAHRIGSISQKNPIRRKVPISSAAENIECQDCSAKSFCVNWCGCSNFFSTGTYNLIGPFECASEKASIALASQVINEMKDNSAFITSHINGTPLLSII